MNIEGTEDPGIPLPQGVLDAMVVEPKLVRLAAYIKGHFKFGDSNETLSDKHARTLAIYAATRLNSGAFNRSSCCSRPRWVGSPPHRWMVCPGPPSHFSVADVRPARRSLRD